jgi:hypothetical protein
MTRFLVRRSSMSLPTASLLLGGAKPQPSRELGKFKKEVKINGRKKNSRIRNLFDRSWG